MRKFFLQYLLWWLWFCAGNRQLIGYIALKASSYLLDCEPENHLRRWHKAGSPVEAVAVAGEPISPHLLHHALSERIAGHDGVAGEFHVGGWCHSHKGCPVEFRI